MPIQARTEFAAALNQIASEKGVDVSVIIDAIEQAALAAYRKDLTLRNEPIPDDFEELTAKIDPASGEISIMRADTNITPPGFARIAAQTAKQVIAQRLHEAEKGAIMEEYEAKVGTVVSGAIQRQEGNTYFIDLGRTEGVMPPSEQTRTEYYAPNQRMKFLIKKIEETGRGPEVIVSRNDAELIKGLFAMEVPEIQSNAVEIKAIAREAGGRTKVAAISTQDGVDPVGSLVGQKGVRVQAVINELGEEKIDIVPFSDDPARFIAAALSPAKDVIVELDEENRVATVTIPESQLSLAIGKGGQNVRLAAKLTGWKIDIEGSGEGTAEEEKQASEGGGAAPVTDDTQSTSDDTAQPVEEEEKKEAEEGIEEEAKVASENAENAEESQEAEEAKETLEKAVEAENVSAEEGQLEKAVEGVGENVDQATEEESVDGATEPEPTEAETAPAASDAEEDMSEENQSDKSEK